MSNFHKNKQILKGKIGEFSKIQEEFEELKDAAEQGDRVLTICELTDLVGAIDFYASNYFNLKIEDLKIFSDKRVASFSNETNK